MPKDRTHGRDVFLYLSDEPNTCVGGLRNNHFTVHDLYSFVHILVLAEVSPGSVGAMVSENGIVEIIQRGAEEVLPDSRVDLLTPGEYIIRSRFSNGQFNRYLAIFISARVTN